MGRHAESWKLHKPRKAGGNYRVRFSHDGKRIDLSTCRRDPGEAGKEAARIYAEVVSGRRKQKVARHQVAPDLVTLFAEWLATLDAELAPSTVEHYEMYAGKYFVHFFDTLSDITKASGTEYAQARLRRVTRKTVLKELSALRRFLGWCEDHGFIDEAPEIRSPSQKATGTRALEHQSIHLTEEQIERVIAGLPETSRGGGRPRAFYRFLWETGLRCGTAHRIVAKDVDFGKGELRIRSEADKARYGRAVPLTSGALKLLREIVPDAGLIFGRHNHRYVLQKAARAAGLTEDQARHFSDHDFRRSRATHWAQNTKNLAHLSYMLGHKNVSTTNLYVQGNKEGARQMLLACGDVVTGVIEEVDSAVFSGVRAEVAVSGVSPHVIRVSEVTEMTTKKLGTEERNRTSTLSPIREPKSRASTNSATSASGLRRSSRLCWTPLRP